MTETILIVIGSILAVLVLAWVSMTSWGRGIHRGYRDGMARGKAEANLEWSTTRLQECVAAMERVEKYLRSKVPDGDEIKLPETVTREDLLSAQQDLQCLVPRRDWDPTGKARSILDRLITQPVKDPP